MIVVKFVVSEVLYAINKDDFKPGIHWHYLQQKAFVLGCMPWSVASSHDKEVGSCVAQRIMLANLFTIKITRTLYYSDVPQTIKDV